MSLFSKIEFAIAEGMGFLVQSPLAIGSQSQIFLRDLNGSAVNLVLEEAKFNPRVQRNPCTSLAIRINLDSGNDLRCFN